MTAKLLIFTTTESKIFSLKKVLGKALDGTGIVIDEADQHNFRQKLDDDVAVFVLSGAKRGTAYREQMHGPNIRHLERHMAEGLQVWAICAGSFVLSQRFRFKDYDADGNAAWEKEVDSRGPVKWEREFDRAGNITSEKKTDLAIGLVDVFAYGVDPRLYRTVRAGESNPWEGYTDTRVNFMFDGRPLSAHFALAKGPSFIELGEGQCESFATYEATGETAVVRFAYGRGGGIMSGPTPEVGGEGLSRLVTQEQRDNPHCNRIITALENSHQNWARMLVGMLESLLHKLPETHARIRENMGVEPKPECKIAPSPAGRGI